MSLEACSPRHSDKGSKLKIGIKPASIQRLDNYFLSLAISLDEVSLG